MKSWPIVVVAVVAMIAASPGLAQAATGTPVISGQNFGGGPKPKNPKAPPASQAETASQQGTPSSGSGTTPHASVGRHSPITSGGGTPVTSGGTSRP